MDTMRICNLKLLLSKARRCMWQLAFGTRRYHFMKYHYKNCDVTSCGSHSACSKELPLTFKLLLIGQIPQPYGYNIT